MSGRTKGGKRLHNGGTKRHKENQCVITKSVETFPREKRSTLWADITNDDLSPSATKVHSILSVLLLLVILQYFKHHRNAKEQSVHPFMLIPVPIYKELRPSWQRK